LSDKQGLLLAISVPIAGNHNELHNIQVQFEVVTGTLELANIPVEGFFRNADEGFDSKEFRICFQKIERTNAWLDSFRSLRNDLICQLQVS